jgi:hypothetical protein
LKTLPGFKSWSACLLESPDKVNLGATLGNQVAACARRWRVFGFLLRLPSRPRPSESNVRRSALCPGRRVSVSRPQVVTVFVGAGFSPAFRPSSLALSLGGRVSVSRRTGEGSLAKRCGWQLHSLRLHQFRTSPAVARAFSLAPLSAPRERLLVMVFPSTDRLNSCPAWLPRAHTMSPKRPPFRALFGTETAILPLTARCRRSR